MPVRSCWWAFALLSLLTFTLTASAQSAASAVIYPPQTESFPRIHAFLDVHDAQGAFIHGIRAEEVRLSENGRSLPLVEFEELRPGVQIVFALSPGSSFSIRNSQGDSRYDIVRNALVGWAQGREGSNLDDLSLLETAGPEVTHFNDSQQLVTTLQSYRPDLENSTPALEILLRAIDLAADTPPRAGMERAVVLITSPEVISTTPQGEGSVGLQELIGRAVQLQVHVSVWMVASRQAFTSQAAASLTGLAEQTGGQFVAFAGDDTPLPDLESYFSPLRDIYQFSYDSNIAGGGTQQLSVEIDHNGEVITSEPVSFEFNLQPPDPAFLSPSAEILRSVPEGKRRSLWQPAGPDDLLPKTQVLKALIDFPDGRARPLVRTALYVDGLLVDEHTGPPFDEFSWDLSRYTLSGQHLLQVEAVDSLGQRGASILMPVQITVELPQPNPLAGMLRRWPVLAGLGLVLLAGAVFLGLVLGGRIHPQLPLTLPRRLAQVARPIRARILSDPKRQAPNWVNRLHWPQRRLHPKAYAYLTTLTETEGKPRLAPISIAADELTFGMDPSRASLVLDDPSVDGLHARLLRQEDGCFRLIDEGSVAGTWVNYCPVGSEGQVLEHGDQVHFGRVGFRFTLREPQPQRKPVITYEEPPD
jgi:hypothetical protein